MVILIAESKTMLSAESDVGIEEYDAHKPLYEETASEIMGSLGSETVADLAAMLKLSGSLAAKMKKMTYEFGFKRSGNPAIEAFTGVVFKALDFATLPDAAKARCREQVRIISSLYGWLRPSDIIKPYRLDFTSRLEGGPAAGKALNAFWRMDVTKALVRKLQEDGATEILDLLPGDASKCIDWKLVKRFAKVWKADFQEMREGGAMKTPTAERLKALRGTLLRQILTEAVPDIETLRNVSSPSYFCEGTPVYPDRLRFLC